MLTVETPYKKVSEELEKIFSLKIPVDSLERMNRDMSVSVIGVNLRET